MTINNDQGLRRYTVTENILMKYRSNAKKAANIDLDFLERKVSAIIENSFELKFNPITCVTTFYFGDFHIETNETDMIVTNIYWTKRKNAKKISKTIKSNLIASYLKFGLSENGNKLVSV